MLQSSTREIIQKKNHFKKFRGFRRDAVKTEPSELDSSGRNKESDDPAKNKKRSERECGLTNAWCFPDHGANDPSDDCQGGRDKKDDGKGEWPDERPDGPEEKSVPQAESGRVDEGNCGKRKEAEKKPGQGGQKGNGPDMETGQENANEAGGKSQDMRKPPVPKVDEGQRKGEGIEAEENEPGRPEMDAEVEKETKPSRGEFGDRDLKE